MKENSVLRDLLKKHGISLPKMLLVVASTSAAQIVDTAETSTDSVSTTKMSSSVSHNKTQAENGTTPAKTSESASKADFVVATNVPSTVTNAVALPTCSSTEAATRESVAYVAPFIIASTPVSMATNTTSVSTLAAAHPGVQVTSPTQLDYVENNKTQASFNQLENTTSSGNDSQRVTIPSQSYCASPLVTQTNNHSIYLSPQQTFHNPHAISTASHAGYSQHSVDAIMNVSSQSGSAGSAVNTIPVVVGSTGQSNVAPVLPCIINSNTVSQSSNGMLTLTTPVSVGTNNFVHQNIDVNNPSVSQSVPTLLVTAVLNDSAAVVSSKVDTTICSKNVSTMVQVGNQGHYVGTTNKEYKKLGTRSRNQRVSKQNKGILVNGKSSASNSKRRSTYLPVTQKVNGTKRTCSSQESPVNMDICQQEEMLNMQNFSVSALIPSLDAQTSAAVITNVPVTMSNKSDCTKCTTQVTSVGVSQTNQIQRLSHSIESLAGLSRSIEQPQSSTAAQQVPSLGPGTLSFSAESLLASSDDILSNIPHITTSSGSESGQSQQNGFSGVIPHSLSDHSSGQSHQGFSHYSAGSLIGGNDLLGDSGAQVITQETQKQSRPSRTTYSDFSAESLIGSSDLNSGLSYAIDNLISSRPDPSYNSAAMVSVNPNLLHSVKSGVAQEAASNPLRALAAMPEMMDHKAVMPSSTNPSTLLGTTTISSCSLGLSPPSSNTVSFSFISATPNNRQLKDSTPQHTGPSSFSNTNTTTNSAASSSFLKHSVDSITSSFYTVGSLGASFSAGTNPATTTASSFHGNSFGMDSLPSQYPLALGNPFSPTKSFLGQSPTMGSFV